MRLEISSRKGKFNWCSDEDEISCHIAVYGDDGVKKYSTNLRTEYMENPELPLVNEAINLLQDCIDRMFVDTSRKKKKELLKFISENEAEIDKGSKEHRVTSLKNEIKKAQDEIVRLII